jgi:hypothetical protein
MNTRACWQIHGEPAVSGPTRRRPRLRPARLGRITRLVGLGGGYGAPALPGDAEDQDRDYEPDHRVGDAEADRDDCGAGEDAEADDAIDPGVVSVREKSGATQATTGPQPHSSCDLVADESDQPRRGKEPEVGEGARVDETVDRLSKRDKGADEYRQDDRKPGETLATCAAEEEGEPERDRGQRVPEVVDQIREQRNAERPRVNHGLGKRRQRQDREAPSDGTDTGPRAKNRPIDRAVRVLMVMRMRPVMTMPVTCSDAGRYH